MFSLNKSNVTLLMSLTNMSEPELNIVTGNSHKQQGLSANHGYILKISYFAVCSLGLLINLLLLGVIIGKFDICIDNKRKIIFQIHWVDSMGLWICVLKYDKLNPSISIKSFLAFLNFKIKPKKFRILNFHLLWKA